LNAPRYSSWMSACFRAVQYFFTSSSHAYRSSGRKRIGAARGATSLGPAVLQLTRPRLFRRTAPMRTSPRAVGCTAGPTPVASVAPDAAALSSARGSVISLPAPFWLVPADTTTSDSPPPSVACTPCRWLLSLWGRRCAGTSMGLSSSRRSRIAADRGSPLSHPCGREGLPHPAARAEDFDQQVRHARQATRPDHVDEADGARAVGAAVARLDLLVRPLLARGWRHRLTPRRDGRPRPIGGPVRHTHRSSAHAPALPGPAAPAAVRPRSTLPELDASLLRCCQARAGR